MPDVANDRGGTRYLGRHVVERVDSEYSTQGRDAKTHSAALNSVICTDIVHQGRLLYSRNFITMQASSESR